MNADQVAVTSTDVTLPDNGQFVTLTVDSLELLLTFDLIERQHINTNPDAVVGIEIIHRHSLNEKSPFIRVKFRSPVDTECEVVWTAPVGTILENTTLTAD